SLSAWRTRRTQARAPTAQQMTTQSFLSNSPSSWVSSPRAPALASFGWGLAVSTLRLGSSIAPSSRKARLPVGPTLPLRARGLRPCLRHGWPSETHVPIESSTPSRNLAEEQDHESEHAARSQKRDASPCPL